jgi:hypothetical protein
MSGITLTISLGGMPVDKMEENEEGMTCPISTQDPEVNEMNKEKAVEEANYRGPNEGVAFRLTEVCGNCEYYNQTTSMMECIGSESDDVGYCQLLKFVCKAENTCDSWEEGGPIEDDDVMYNKQDIL